MPLDKVIAAIQSARDHFHTSVVARVRNDVTAVTAQLTQITRGSSHTGILRAVAAARSGRDHLDTALRHLLTASQHLDSYLAVLVGTSPAPRSPTPEPSATSTPNSTADPTAAAATAAPNPTPVGTRWSRTTVVPEEVRKAATDFLPRPSGVNRPTTGSFLGRVVESGGRDKSIAGDLRHDPLRGPPVTFYQHVESKVAAQMRRDGIASADLIVDNTVCGSNQHDQEHEWSCERILPAILPAGSQLTVWLTRDGGQTWWRATYTGTGERITR